MNIDPKEVKRYLAVRGEGGDIDRLIDELSKKALSLLCPKSVTNRFDVAQTEKGLELVGTGVFFPGELVKKTFEGCGEIFLFAATLTLESETFLKQCFAKSALHGVVCDGVLTTMIESYCDDIDAELCRRAAAEGKQATRRISCGYGDFPLHCQGDILRLLNAQKFLGIRLNQNDMMFPNKTVTAAMGVKKLGAADVKGFSSADKCKTCGMHCGFERNYED